MSAAAARTPHQGRRRIGPPPADPRTGSESRPSQMPSDPRLSLEAHLDPVLAVLGVVEGPKRPGPEVRLNIGRQERGQRVPHPQTDPRLELEDPEAALDAGL